MKFTFTFDIDIDIDNTMNFSDIVQQVTKSNLNKLAFIECVKWIDEFETTKLAGEKYKVHDDDLMERAGNTSFTVLTDFGLIDLSLNQVKDENGHHTVLKRFIECGREQLTPDHKKKIREIILETTYRRTSNIFNLLSGAGFNKDVIWNTVMELGISASETYSPDPSKYDLILIDGSGGKAKHAWYAFIGLNSISGEMYPIHNSVGVSLAEIKKDLLSKGLLKPTDIIVADGELGIHRQFSNHKIQMCAFHFEQNLCYKLWEEDMDLSERKKVNQKVKQILNTLKNSVTKNAGNNPKRIDRRIEKTKIELKDLATSLMEKGYSRAAAFIMKYLDKVTLFAKESIRLVKVPWTNNIMERFVGEVSFRIKNRWAHWSKVGLNTMISLVVQRYCSRNTVKMEF